MDEKIEFSRGKEADAGPDQGEKFRLDRRERTRRLIKKSLALTATFAVVMSGLILAGPQPAEARIATGGTGKWRSMLNWMEWPGDASGKISNGAVAQTRQQIGDEILTSTCTLTRITASDGAGDLYRYRSGSWQGDALDELYNIGGTGTNNQLVSGISNGQNPRNPGTMSFHVSCEADVDGRPIPMAGLVFADAEQNNYQPNGQQESIAATPDDPDSVTWRIMERTKTNGCATGTWVSRYADTERLRMMSTADQCSGSPGGPIVMTMMEGVSSATFELWSNNGAVSALALGVVHYADFGDAPERYGIATALSTDTLRGGEIPVGHTQAFNSGAPADATVGQPLPRLGARVDPEANPLFSADARGDDTNGVDDEDSITIPATIETQQGQTYTSPPVSCFGPGNVVGWMDWNGNGAFDDAERSTTVVCGEGEHSVTLDWQVPADVVVGASTTFLRLRIADPDETFGPTGTTFSGEVEDHRVQLQVEEMLTASDDESRGNNPGSPVTLNVLDNDSGNADPSTVNITDSDGNPTKELTVPGEGVWTVNDDGSITFTPEDGFLGDPTPISYTVEDENGNQATAKVVVTYLPDAVDDESLGNDPGSPVTLDVLDNDLGNMDPSTVQIIDPESGEPTKQLTVPGEGVWHVNDDGTITFTPEEGFTGDPTPIVYEVADEKGEPSRGNVTVTYLPVAADDESHGNTQGESVTVNVLENDSDNVDPSTVNITDPDGNPTKELTVPGEGTWLVDPETGAITFTPEDGFTGNPTPISYTVEDPDGNTTGADVVVTYLPEAQDDESHGNTIGDAVTVPVLGNDSTNLDPTSVLIVDPETGDGVSELVVPGEGTWKTDPETGAITFTPEDGFKGNPTPIDYTAVDDAGNPVTATVTVTYLPEATDDESLNNTRGEAVTLSVLDNDSDNLGPSTVNITDPDGNPVKELTVPGEGVWTVNGDGTITFTPEDGFEGNPTDIAYTVENTNGDLTGANVHVTYIDTPAADDDRSDGNTIGDAVTVPVLGNDSGSNLDPSTVRITDPASGDPVTELVVPGEGTWTVDAETGDITFTPEDGFTGNPAPIDYTVEDEYGNETGATVTVTYLPEASDDESLNNKQGETVTVPTLENDKGDLDPATVRITDPASGDQVTELVVPGEGTWTVDPETGDITFTPEDGFEGNPTPIDYTVEDVNGNPTGATVTVTYIDAPQARDDRSEDNPPRTPVTLTVLENDEGDLDPSTVNITDPDGNPVKELTVPGEGVWTVDDEGEITFTPEDGYTGDPTPIHYTVEDEYGNETGAKVEVDYLPEAADDESLDNPRGDAVTLNVLENDSDDLDPTTVNITDPDGNPVKELTVPGEGVWTVDPETGAITFTPEDGFEGQPTDIAYTVQDSSGNETGANVHVTYIDEEPPAQPEARNDESLNNPRGESVSVPVLDNDEGDLDPTTVNITDPDGNPVKELTVPGEGVWTVDPETGAITFTPEDGFEGQPTDIAYTVQDSSGNETGANVHVTYIDDPGQQPEAADDESRGNEQGKPVTVPVLGNDEGDFDPSTLAIIDPRTGQPVKELEEPGEGVWRVDDEGNITFTPDQNFTGNPTPIEYVISDEDGNDSRATVVVTYLPRAADDESSNNEPGSTVTVKVLDNDSDNVDPSTVMIIDPNSGNPVQELTVPGEGVWTVNDDGTITFTPEKGFTGNPIPVEYQVSDADGNPVVATVTITYLNVRTTPPPTDPPVKPGSPEPGDRLPVTGIEAGTAWIAGVLLLGLGATLLVRRRRRQDELG
ncbi:CshA/CshB family fibrillar adhesin-related protein [Agromyces sp. NPDC060279]|uniref:CshA/CshB family fibrillar adhesin-related protein n=1 Tax=Agromyces sp. NPDC060279 TaxID=3347092 RepID=UPI0036651468